MGDPSSILGSGRFLGEGNGYPFQYSCPGNPRQRSLVGYGSWGGKDSDTTEREHSVCPFTQFKSRLLVIPLTSRLHKQLLYAVDGHVDRGKHSGWALPKP